MNGKTVLITGATAGLGRATAAQLAQQGARVTVCGRDPDKTARVAADIRARTGNAHVDHLTADLSALREVRGLASEFSRRHQQLDVLINNVGGIWAARHTTVDGLERTFALNHLAPFLLTSLLLDQLKATPSSRIVNLASQSYSWGRIDFEDLQGERDFSGMRAYRQSKLANLLFTYELARRLQGTGVTANVLNPGGVRTDFYNGKDLPPTIRAEAVFLPLMQSSEAGARACVHLASSPEVANTTGQYFVKRRPKKSKKMSHSRELADRLWRVSADLAGTGQ
ncbi:SDR family NAD(P)-dependent oxidoreductase [Streptomyces parvulus]|uniref:SDR family NAD(P)-dependent oxidoreductase n=1 Tax=Streptomyces parvulus TaxID=146923 RepID=A0A369UXT7_9ACTN|nr:SDR family NAD(P)-dependent oxidoreductase [Streptomyces parvulus]